MLIDAHQHFWRIGQNDCVWPTPELAAIHRDFEPRDLRAAAGSNLAGAVTVQSQPSDADTDWLLRLAEDEPLILGVVGWVDLLSPRAPERIAALSARSKFKGVRPMLQDLPDDAWIAHAGLAPAIDALVAHGLSLDALVFTRHLPHLLTLATRRPDLRIVIDHGAKPPIAGEAFDEWAEAMSRLAALPQVHCKLSGLLTEARPDQPPEAITPYVDRLIALFGPDRLMWGSDWPVVNLATDYAAWLGQVKNFPALRDPAFAQAVFSDVARRFYRLDAGPQ
ncbi:amidohydrolase [Caulobacter segnis]|uniref:Amidohydrolase 2 n=2 Tax=Caulobacter segnis TaxID=88688 RepID=D5VJ99_CAUST|nr:amidohydrolase family protein [Caulobacter segnis]ADG10308.1 amidohydrolase 2 [Caulobacter segnis ATCC 21756]AVQ02042.1 amidohydrolase [Caulobacter segnis]